MLRNSGRYPTPRISRRDILQVRFFWENPNAA